MIAIHTLPHTIWLKTLPYNYNLHSYFLLIKFSSRFNALTANFKNFWGWGGGACHKTPVVTACSVSAFIKPLNSHITSLTKLSAKKFLDVSSILTLTCHFVSTYLKVILHTGMWVLVDSWLTRLMKDCKSDLFVCNVIISKTVLRCLDLEMLLGYGSKKLIMLFIVVTLSAMLLF